MKFNLVNIMLICVRNIYLIKQFNLYKKFYLINKKFNLCKKFYLINEKFNLIPKKLENYISIKS